MSNNEIIADLQQKCLALGDELDILNDSQIASKNDLVEFKNKLGQLEKAVSNLNASSANQESILVGKLRTQIAEVSRKVDQFESTPERGFMRYPLAP